MTEWGSHRRTTKLAEDKMGGCALLTHGCRRKRMMAGDGSVHRSAYGWCKCFSRDLAERRGRQDDKGSGTYGDDSDHGWNRFRHNIPRPRGQAFEPSARDLSSATRRESNRARYEDRNAERGGIDVGVAVADVDSVTSELRSDICCFRCEINPPLPRLRYRSARHLAFGRLSTLSKKHPLLRRTFVCI